MVHWRWLIIDEFAIVFAEVFAEIDAKLRAHVSKTNRFATRSDGRAALFGGVNVVLVGDLRQLLLPTRTFLGTRPQHMIDPLATKEVHPPAKHGQELLWPAAVGATDAFQGVTELIQSERSKDDEWLQ